MPNLTLGPPIVKSLRPHVPDAYLDVHLMVTNPADWVAPFAAAGASGFTFHVEAVAPEGVAPLIDAVRAAGMAPGVALKPDTPASAVLGAPWADKLALVLVMTVEPGFGGQAFQPAQLRKVAELRAALPNVHVQVDGGLGLSNVAAATAAGANVIVAGTSVFSAADARVAIESLRKEGALARA